ncbi:otopetrin-2 [Platysternon megacephalum]|uniref:Otopetrin-2 n=1 Tax=Platysternon megacephalum TaxID=55544 RepID=A0A4D9DEG3_9SAUR|nr:otopetrin-2 [Platysternon megacephalum]
MSPLASLLQAKGNHRSVNGYCHYNSSELLANITGYVNVPAGDVTALRAAVFKNGPVAVSIDASAKSFIFYSNGIYYDPQCGECSPASSRWDEIAWLAGEAVSW